MRQIVALGGGGFLMEPGNPRLDDFLLGLKNGADSRVCFLATASGDSDRMLVNFYSDLAPRCRATHLPLFRRASTDLESTVMAQDILYVGGGNTANMIAVWRVHGLDAILRRAYDAGILLCGVSAGALCWFESGVTDSFGSLDRFDDGLGLISGSFCPHYDGEPGRRPAFQRLVGDGLPGGYAADDGAALHFIDGELRQVVASRPNARAFRVSRLPGGVEESAIPTRYLQG